MFQCKFYFKNFTEPYCSKKFSHHSSNPLGQERHHIWWVALPSPGISLIARTPTSLVDPCWCVWRAWHHQPGGLLGSRWRVWMSTACAICHMLTVQSRWQKFPGCESNLVNGGSQCLWITHSLCVCVLLTFLNIVVHRDSEWQRGAKQSLFTGEVGSLPAGPVVCLAPGRLCLTPGPI